MTLEKVKSVFNASENLMLEIVSKLLIHFKMIDDQSFRKLVQRFASILMGTSDLKEQPEIVSVVEKIILLFNLSLEEELAGINKFEFTISNNPKPKFSKTKMSWIDKIGSSNISRIGSSCSKMSYSLASNLHIDERNWRNEVQSLIKKYENGEINEMTEGEKESEEIFNEIYFLLKGFYGKERPIGSLPIREIFGYSNENNDEIESDDEHNSKQKLSQGEEIARKIISLAKSSGQTKELMIMLKQLHGLRLPYYNLNRSVSNLDKTMMSLIKEKKNYNLNKSLTMINEESMTTPKLEARKISICTVKELNLKGIQQRLSICSVDTTNQNRASIDDKLKLKAKASKSLFDKK